MARLVILTLEAAEARAIRTLIAAHLDLREHEEDWRRITAQTITDAREAMRKLTKEIDRAERKVRE